MGLIRQQMTYNWQFYPSHRVLADRRYRNPKTCSACGTVKTGLELNEGSYHCSSWGLVLGRDLNAAINLAG